MEPVFITVIGQCMGNRDTEGADYYFKKLTRITLLLSTAWNLIVFLLTPLFLRFYALEPETSTITGRLSLFCGKSPVDGKTFRSFKCTV